MMWVIKQKYEKTLFNRALTILLFTNSIILIAASMLGPIYAIFVEKIGGDLMDASLAGALFALTAGFTALISGRFSDKVREKKSVIVLGYLIMGIGFLSYIWVDSIIFLFVAQSVIGFGEAIYSPAFDALYSKHLDRNHYGTEWGAWECVNYFATAIGAVIGGWVVTFFGFEVLFVCMSILAISSALFISQLKEKVL